MKKSCLSLLVFTVTLSSFALSQTGNISGVVSSDGQGLPGANVILEGTPYGTAANVSGEYYIANVPVGDYTVNVTYVGYANMSQEVTINTGEESKLNFSLKMSAINLDQIVVTGTGAPAKRKALGQTINIISSDDLTSGSVQTVTDALQGRIPGLVGASMGGQGAASRIRLRGTVSLTQRNQPLIYIDGVRIDNSMTDNASISTSRLNDIDPNNIDHIEVIKGAAAATLFGTEASSGVIQIFTKRGIIGKPTYSFRTNQKIAKIDAKNRVDDNYGYDETTRTIMTNNPAIDYMKNSHQQDYSFSVRGGSPGMKYYASANWADLPGSQPKNSVDKWSLRTALDFQNSDKLSSSIDISLTENSQMAPMPWWGFWAEIMLCDPSNVSELRPYGGQDYTVAGALTWNSEEVTDNRLISAKIDYKWNDNIRSSFQLGLNDVLVRTTRFVPKGGANPASPSKGARDRWHREKDILTIDFKTNANYNISERLVSSTVIGAQSFTEVTNQQQVSVSNFPAAALSTLRGGSSVTNVDEFEETVINAGVFFQEQLGLDDRLFLTVGMRMDGNSAFGEDFGFETYPKAGLSWVVSEEPFWNFSAINQFRLRAAFGTSGLQPGAFDAQRTWRPASGIENNGAVLPLNLGNKDLKPERSQEIEFGAEFSAFNDLLGVEAVYYTQQTTDALLPVALSPSLGFQQAQLTNIGGMESNGLELSGNWTVFKKDAVSVKLEGSYSNVDQKVTDMGGVAPFRIEGRRRWSQIKEGYQPGAIIAPVHDPANPWSTSVPIDQVTHRSQIYPNMKKDANGDDALEYIGNSSPSYTYTFGSTVKFSRSFSLKALFRGEGDFLISRESELIRQNLGYNKTAADLAYALDPANNVSLDERKKHIEGYGNRHPNVFSDWMEAGDYLKFQELALIWQVPSDITGKLGVKSATVSFNARNLHIFTDFEGYIDPGGGRASRSEFLQNIDYMSGPSPIFYGVSINTTF